MSIREYKSKKKKGKYPRNRISRKLLHKRKIRKKIFKNRGWKLAYPEFFQVIDEFPYIIRRNNEEVN
ncbi:MAG: hypothetical protein KGD63_12340 [Candidatus Lokiarchaeota archaeon]|nr:hypothetical protein [Candidatus Lokiarchaeota archaeon]